MYLTQSKKSKKKQDNRWVLVKTMVYYYYDLLFRRTKVLTQDKVFL